jgi:hypothetical protein
MTLESYDASKGWAVARDSREGFNPSLLPLVEPDHGEAINLGLRPEPSEALHPYTPIPTNPAHPI